MAVIEILAPTRTPTCARTRLARALNALVLAADQQRRVVRDYHQAVRGMDIAVQGLGRTFWRYGMVLASLDNEVAAVRTEATRLANRMDAARAA